MWPEVIEAMDYAARHKVRMSDLQDAVGGRIADLLGAESAIVTSGATGAIILGTAACMTLGDQEKMERLPDSTNMPNEVLILESQRYLYDRSIRAPGSVLVEVASEADIRAAVNERTAMFFYLQNRPENLDIDVERLHRPGKGIRHPHLLRCCDDCTAGLRNQKDRTTGVSISSVIPAAKGSGDPTVPGSCSVDLTSSVMRGKTVHQITAHTDAA